MLLFTNQLQTAKFYLSQEAELNNTMKFLQLWSVYNDAKKFVEAYVK